jgi:hypothetical protein
MKEIILYVLTILVTSYLIAQWKKDLPTLPHPHLATSQSLFIVSGYTSDHPTLKLYERVYLLTDQAFLNAPGISAIRLIKKQ